MSELTKPEIEVIITVAQDRRTHLKQLASELQSKGLKVTNSMEDLGMISGTAAADNLEQFRNVDGVAAVEAVGTVQLPPPDSDIQ
jgi:ferritin-like protein